MCVVVVVVVVVVLHGRGRVGLPRIHRNEVLSSEDPELSKISNFVEIRR